MERQHRGDAADDEIREPAPRRPSDHQQAEQQHAEQGETPGLGANIATPAWQAKWPGTSLVNEEGELAIDIVQAGASRPWQVDGITGATLSVAAVTRIARVALLLDDTIKTTG